MKIIKLFQKAGKKRSVLSEIAEGKKKKTMKVENEKKKGEWDTHFLTRSGSEEWQGQKPDGDGRGKKGRKSSRANGVFKSFSTLTVFSYLN